MCQNLKLFNLKVHYYIYKSLLPLVPFINQVNPAHILTSCSSKISFNISPIYAQASHVVFPSDVLTKIFIRSFLSYVLHSPPHHSVSSPKHMAKNIVMKLLIIEFSQTLRCSLFLISKYNILFRTLLLCNLSLCSSLKISIGLQKLHTCDVHLSSPWQICERPPYT
jgi:hypothetical protein